ncbi:hypothetical protein NWP21_02555, partial [Anabaenopsis sp. FSS-46]|uniref:hypothetical protein n=1 Tax=Anabaenopsis sp. FSS-46 TaxID=2971766 RepID=UPI002475C6B4
NNYSISEGWKAYQINVGNYFTGNFNYLTLVNDHDVLNPNADSQFRNLKIYENTNNVSVNINGQTNDHLISPYDPQQDLNGEFTISDDQTQLDLFGNTWKKLDINNYTITKDTILEFQFRSTSAGEIHAIGFDTDNVISPLTTFKLSGTQNWGLQNYNNYSISEGWKAYQINVGNYFTGNFNYLTLVNDHDVLNPNADSQFRNIQLYEDRIWGFNSPVGVNQLG